MNWRWACFWTHLQVLKHINVTDEVLNLLKSIGKTTFDFDEVWISSFSHHVLLPPSFHSHHKKKKKSWRLCAFLYSSLDSCFELCTGSICMYKSQLYICNCRNCAWEDPLQDLQASAYENLILEALWFQSLSGELGRWGMHVSARFCNECFLENITCKMLSAAIPFNKSLFEEMAKWDSILQKSDNENHEDKKRP